MDHQRAIEQAVLHSQGCADDEYRIERHARLNECDERGVRACKQRVLEEQIFVGIADSPSSGKGEKPVSSRLRNRTRQRAHRLR